MGNIDEDPSVLNALLELEIQIDRPVAHVWRQWLDMGSWVTSHHFEIGRGTLDSVGSIMRVSSRRAKEAGDPPPHYHYCKIIKLVPERLYILKTYPERGGSYGMEFTGFDEARFIPVEGGTNVVYRFIGEYRRDAGANHAFVKDPDDDDGHMWKNLQNLKCVVECS